MNNIPIMPDANFRAIKAWFAGTDAAKEINKLELIVVEKEFPGVVNFICGGTPRYFLVPAELTSRIANSVFQQTPVTPAEGAFLNCIKSQLDGRVQVMLDTKSDEVAEKVESLPGFIRCFEAPCARGEGFKRFVAEVRAPNE